MADDIVIRFMSTDNVTPTAEKVSGSIKNVSKTTNTANSSTQSLLTTMAGYGAVIGAVIGVATGIGKVALSAAGAYDKLENFRKSFVMLTGDVTVGNKLFELVQRFAERTPLETSDVTRYAQQLLGVGIAGDSVIPIIKAVGNATFAMGGDTDSASRAMLALTQMQAKGKVGQEEINQLTEAGIPIMGMMAKYYGISTEKMQKYVEQGLDVNQFVKDFVAASNQQYGGAMEGSLGTVTQATSNFNDALTHLQEEMGKQLSPVLTSGIVFFTDVLKDSTIQMARWAEFSKTLTMPTFGLDQEALNFLDLFWKDAKQGAINYANDVSAYLGIANTEIVKNSGVVSLAGDDLRAAYMKLHPELNNTAKATVPLISGMKGTSGASNKLAQDEKSLKSAVDSLRTSFLNITSAQRDVKRTREALEDATNPETLQTYEIAADRAFYSNELLTNEITRMNARQKQVRAELQKGNLSQDQRNELQIEDAQLTEDLIGKNLDAKDSVIQLHKAQKDLDRARDPARIEEYADAHTNAILRLNELNAKQLENIKTVGDLSVALKANVDVTTLLGQAAALTATPLDGIDSIGTDIANTFSRENGVNAALGTTSKALYSIGTNSGSAVSGIAKVNEALGTISVDNTKSAGLTAISSALSGLASTGSALVSIDFQGILGGIVGKVATLTSAVVAPWIALNAQLAATLKLIKELQGVGSGGGGNGGGNGGGGTPDIDTQLNDWIKTYFTNSQSPNLLTAQEYAALESLAGANGITQSYLNELITGYLSQHPEATTYNPPVFGASVPDMGNGGGGGSIFGGKSVTIILNYATPPNSSNPLKDVEDYITAQGGLIRV